VDEPSASFGLVQLEGTAIRGDDQTSTRFSKAYHSMLGKAVHSMTLAASFLILFERGNVWKKFGEDCECTALWNLAETVTINARTAVEKDTRLTIVPAHLMS
jgi:hypothetical protein